MVSGNGPLVLVAENLINRRAHIISGLASEGFRTAEAFNGEHCLTRVKSLAPDAVLMNARMPVTDGLQACREIRALPQGKSIGVFLLSDTDDPQLHQAAAAAGANAVLTEPLDLREFADRLRSLLPRPGPAAAGSGDDSLAARGRDNIAHIGRWEWSIAANRLDAMPECYRIIELASGETLDQMEDLLGFVPEMERWTVRKWLDNAISTGEADYLGHHIETPDGSLKYVLQHVESIVDAAGTTVAIHGAMQDITKLRHGEVSIFRLAYYDALTNLPNRRSFEAKLRREISVAVRRNGRAAILFVDVDDFKQVNDRFGHDTGDQVLRTIAKRLTHVIRDTDLVGRDQAADETSIARFGGDEFLLLLSDIGRPEDAGEIAQRILETVRRPIQVDSREILVTTSIGIAICPDQSSNPADLIKNADAAMYEAKYQGKDRCHFFRADSTKMSEIPLEAAPTKHHGESKGTAAEAEVAQTPVLASTEGELERLRKENQRLQQERDILIRAANIIAKGRSEQIDSPGSG